ncbi:HNH endonuclease [Salipiger thiooxidans]|uniref:HNH endonuclease n=1 Tax=Salipiger thiooxidans TaxID=282683 RepID=UPI001A8D3B10|nr:HNH endonuclease signature motif containing protein [Salipiger thiooxidans]MBN8189508.1 HNH endonuclease [Salipiger thiooxidans]
MTRRRWTAKRRLALFEAHKGTCHICGEKIDGTREAWDVEHIIPLAMGGDDDEGNCAPAHASCHKAKTKEDAGNIAKANRVRAKHFGARDTTKRKMSYRRFNGEPVWRD